MDDAFLDMSPEEMKELLTEFLTEGDSHLQVLNDKLLQAEDAIKTGVDMPDEDMNAMFRAAHTVKGTASFISLKKIVKLTHEMETILQRVKEKEMNLTLEIIDVLFTGFDKLEELFESLRENGVEEGDISESVAKIQKVLLTEEPDEKIIEPEEKGSSVSETNVDIMESHQAQAAECSINEKYLRPFIIDADENIEQFNAKLMALEESKDDINLVNDLFRFMHTIKGAAGLVNAVTIQSVSHKAENILSCLRDKKTDASDKIISLLFDSIDVIRALVDSLKTGEKANVEVKSIEDELNFILSEISDENGREKFSDNKDEDDKNIDVAAAEDDFNIEMIGAENKAIMDQALSEGKKIYKFIIVIEEIVPVKSMKLMIAEQRLQKKGDILFMSPSVDDISDDDECHVKIIYSTMLNINDIQSLILMDGAQAKNIICLQAGVMQEDEKQSVPKVAADVGGPDKGQKNVTQVHPVASKSTPIEISTIRVDSHKIDNLMNLSGELVITRARFSQLVSYFHEEILAQKDMVNLFNEVKTTNEILSKEMKLLSQTNPAVGKSLKVVEMMDSRLDNLDKKISQGKIIPMIHSLDEVTSSLGKIASDIQTGVMQTRMIAIEGIFTRFKRVVRDISKTLKKNVNLVIEGEDTELDKKIVDSLGDPLTHMIRNAVDHGIEDKETRLANGKSEVGSVFLRAVHQGNNICIEVGDDGKGLDAEKIAQSAIKKEILTQEQVEKMTEKEKLDLVFSPGFSTAQKVTNVSGRGVGMDVVKNMITSVNGIVDIETTPGAGSTFILKIPLTLAIIQALLVVVNDETYAFPLETVIEIIKVSDEEIYSIDGNDTVKLRGHALSVVGLEGIIKIDNEQKDLKTTKKIVVVSDGEYQLGVVVDDLIGEDEIVIKSLTDHFSGVKGITGASILGDGRIALILDPTTIIREAR